MKIQENDIISMVYTLEILSCKGLTIRETVHNSLVRLKEWYEQLGEKAYLELALLQICALCQIGLAQEEDEGLYRELCALADTNMEALMENCTEISKHIKISRQGICRLIGKWMPNKNNPMTKSEVVDDIIDKLMNRKTGQYYYHYRKSRCGDSHSEIAKKDLYKLVINGDESFFLDLKKFRIYTFEI